MTYVIILLSLFFGMIFTDLPFFPQKTATHSLMFLIAPLFSLFILITKRFNLKFNVYTVKIYILYLLSTLQSSLFLLTYTTLYLRADIYKYGINFLIKFGESFFTFSLLHFFVLFILIYTFEKINMKKLKIIFFSTFFFLSLTAFIEYLNPTIIDIFHESPKEYARLRLFNMEPSQAGINYFIFYAISLLFIKSMLIKIFITIIFILVLFLIGSKGLFFTLSISLFIMLIYSLKRLTFKNPLFVLFIFIVGILLTYVVYIYMIPILLKDIEEFTSFSTRSSSFIASILVLLNYPLGTGYGTYIYYFPKLLEQGYYIINDIITKFIGISLSFIEIELMISTGINLGAKGGLQQIIMLNGWLGLIFFLSLFKYSLKTIKKLSINYLEKIILYLTIIVLIFQLTFGSDFTLLYSIWIPLALIERLRNEG